MQIQKAIQKSNFTGNFDVETARACLKDSGANLYLIYEQLEENIFELSQGTEKSR